MNLLCKYTICKSTLANKMCIQILFKFDLKQEMKKFLLGFIPDQGHEMKVVYMAQLHSFWQPSCATRTENETCFAWFDVSWDKGNVSKHGRRDEIRHSPHITGKQAGTLAS